jgi:hypothetical protein
VLLVYVVVLQVGVVMLIVALVLGVLLGMVGVGDNSLVVSHLVSRHSVLCGLGFRAVAGGCAESSPWKGNRTFAVVGLGLYPCPWCFCHGPAAWGILWCSSSDRAYFSNNWYNSCKFLGGSLMQ